MKKVLTILAIFAMVALASCTKKEPVQATITASDVTVEEGSTVKINASTNSTAKITFVSDNTAVATVAADGTVTGVAAGTAKVTISLNSAIYSEYLSNNAINGKECKYLYYAGNSQEDEVSLKYKYDKWVTNIIFGCFILVLNLGLALFGFLLFKQTDGQSGAVALQ